VLVGGPRIPRQERAHAAGEGAAPRADQAVDVVRGQGPGGAGEGPLLRQDGEAGEEVDAVGVIPEDYGGPPFPDNVKLRVVSPLPRAATLYMRPSSSASGLPALGLICVNPCGSTPYSTFPM
jgi:hypothetical protein